MNNRRKISKLGRTKSNRTAMLRNMVTSLVLYEHMQTTPAKAKALIPVFDKVIKTAKHDNKDIARRTLSTILFGENAIDKALEVFAKRFANENSGFVKKYKVGERKGDNADQVILMVKGYEYKDIGKKTKSAEKKSDKNSETKKSIKQNPNTNSGNLTSQIDSGVVKGKAKSRSGI